jgi:hypothetical protein
MKNLNADFLLDIWADLKAKRLAPVAVGLIAAVVAMPALLLKGEDNPSAGALPIIAAPASSDDGAEVELAKELADGSKLDSYKAHDPFSGVGKSAGTADAGTSGTAIAPGDVSTGDGATDDNLLKALGGGGSSGSSSDPQSVPGFGTPDSGGGLTTGGDNPPTTVKRPDERYTYELDVKFGRPGREKRYRHLSRMGFLPSPKIPALLFMGVPVDAKSAIFFVHPGLSHQGEGQCIPSESHCNFIELAIGRDEFLAVNDYEFRMHIVGIHRVKLDPDAGQARQSTGTSRSGRDAGEGPSGADADVRELPALVDGIG